MCKIAKGADFQPLFYLGANSQMKNTSGRHYSHVIATWIVRIKSPACYGFLVGLLFGVAPQRCP